MAKVTVNTRTVEKTVKVEEKYSVTLEVSPEMALVIKNMLGPNAGDFTGQKNGREGYELYKALGELMTEEAQIVDSSDVFQYGYSGPIVKDYIRFPEKILK